MLGTPLQIPQAYPNRQPNRSTFNDQNRYTPGQDYNNSPGSNWNQTRQQNGPYDSNPQSGLQNNYFNPNNSTVNHTYHGHGNQTHQQQPQVYPHYPSQGDYLNPNSFNGKWRKK